MSEGCQFGQRRRTDLIYFFNSPTLSFSHTISSLHCLLLSKSTADNNNRKHELHHSTSSSERVSGVCQASERFYDVDGRESEATEGDGTVIQGTGGGRCGGSGNGGPKLVFFNTNYKSITHPYNPKLYLLHFKTRHHYPTSFRCFVATGDLPAGPTSLRWPHFPSATDVSILFGLDSEGSPSSVNGGGVKLNAKEKNKKWSRNRESYMADDSEPLPLPMTYPDSSPVPPEEIDRRLRCDPQVQL